MIITEIQYFFSKIIRFQAIFKDTVEFTCALEFKISSQPFYFIPIISKFVYFFLTFCSLNIAKCDMVEVEGRIGGGTEVGLGIWIG